MRVDFWLILDNAKVSINRSRCMSDKEFDAVDYQDNVSIGVGVSLLSKLDPSGLALKGG